LDMLLVILYCSGALRALHSFPTRRSSDLVLHRNVGGGERAARVLRVALERLADRGTHVDLVEQIQATSQIEPERHRAQPERAQRSEEHTSELQSQSNLVCRLLLEKKKKIT